MDGPKSSCKKEDSLAWLEKEVAHAYGLMTRMDERLYTYIQLLTWSVIFSVGIITFILDIMSKDKPPAFNIAGSLLVIGSAFATFLIFSLVGLYLFLLVGRPYSIIVQDTQVDSFRFKVTREFEVSEPTHTEGSLRRRYRRYICIKNAKNCVLTLVGNLLAGAIWGLVAAIAMLPVSYFSQDPLPWLSYFIPPAISLVMFLLEWFVLGQRVTGWLYGKVNKC